MGREWGAGGATALRSWRVPSWRARRARGPSRPRGARALRARGAAAPGASPLRRCVRGRACGRQQRQDSASARLLYYPLPSRLFLELAREGHRVALPRRRPPRRSSLSLSSSLSDSTPTLNPPLRPLCPLRPQPASSSASSAATSARLRRRRSLASSASVVHCVVLVVVRCVALRCVVLCVVLCVVVLFVVLCVVVAVFCVVLFAAAAAAAAARETAAVAVRELSETCQNRDCQRIVRVLSGSRVSGSCQTQRRRRAARTFKRPQGG